MGFSAGGYIAGASAVLLGNDPVNAPGYHPDAVDLEDGRASFLGLIYPVVSFEGNPNMLSILAGNAFFDEEKRPALMAQYSLTARVRADSAPQFLCYGTRDRIQGQRAYGERLDALGVPHKTLVLPGATHGFALRNRKYAYWGDEYVKWITGLED